MKTRIAASLLALSAYGLILIASKEGYEPVARSPIAGDVPTVGFGDTGGNGRGPVKAGETTTPVRALVRLGQHTTAAEKGLRVCLGDATLTQGEWDALVALAINVGPGAVCRSSIPRKALAGDYVAMCDTFLDFVRFKGRVLPGLVNARKKEAEVCKS